MIMENNNDWFENLNYSSIDHQQQSFVTKHDLELLHKKIIATDLIVQKYQEANKALLRLQVENDELQKQIEQITNECCIFSKQVTECTQECDGLKEQIDILNSEKRDLHQQIRLLQDENTNNHHEIMVLRQFESLKDINEQLTKTVERQQKAIGKLQLQVQRKSPVVYKPIKSQQELSETNIALTKSQKSILELRLALGRLVNFIQLSKIEIPTGLRIRPVLKAHDITDDFLEIEGDIPRNPVIQSPKPIVSQTNDDDDDDDDDHGDFIDVNHSIATPPIQKTAVIEQPPIPSRPEQKKPKAKKKTRRTKNDSTSENTSTKLDELANELEMALSQNTDQPISSLTDDDEDANPKPSMSDNSQSFQTNSRIMILKPINSVRVNESTLTKQQISVNKQIRDSSRMDSITPMEIETSNKRTHYMSFLSEDDDENNKSISSISTQEHISPLDINESTHNQDDHLPTLSYKSLSNQQMEITSDKIQNSSLTTNDQTVSSNILNSNHCQIVFRLLNVLTQVPVPLEHLRLIRRRIPNKSIHEQSVDVSAENKIDNEIRNPTINETNQEVNTVVINYQISNTIVEPTTSTEVSTGQMFSSIESLSKFDEQTQDPTDDIHENLTTNIKENDCIEDTNMIVSEKQFQSEIIVEENRHEDKINQIVYDLHSPTELHSEDNHPTEELDTSVTESQTLMEVEETHSIEEKNRTISEELSQFQPGVEVLTSTISEKPKNTSISMEEYHYIDENDIKVVETAQQHRMIDRSNDNITESTTTTSEIPHKSSITIEEIYPNDCSKFDPNSKNLSPLKQSTTSKELPTITVSQERISTVQTLQLERPAHHLVLESSSLQPFQISIITRLLNTLINLPVKPLHFPVPYPTRKQQQQQQQKSVITKSSISISRQPSTRSSHSPTRIQTRSLNSIRARIALCNQPTTVTKKRTITESISQISTSNVKRIKSSQIETNNNEYDLINQYLHSSNKDINELLKEFLQRKLHEDISSLINELYRIIREFLIRKCDIKRTLTKQLQTYEISIKTLLIFINNQSTNFQQEFIKKLNQTFEYDLKQELKSNEQIIILNRLFILTCSIFASSLSITIYPRLFDIGYSLSQDILEDALTYVSNKFSSLISNEIRTKSSNILLHKVLFDILKFKQTQISSNTLENLLITYEKQTHDQHDLIRCFILLFRHRTWSWCSIELCSKILFPLLEQINDHYQRLTFLMILQFILLTYKNDEYFKQDIHFHQQLKQRLELLKTVNQDECTLRNNILSILCNPVLSEK